MPDEAIKVFDRGADGKIVLRAQSSSGSEALVALEHIFHKKTIIVEDRLAQAVVLHVLRDGGVAKLNSIDVKYLPGGASTMLSRLLPPWALEGRDDILLLDGDRRIDEPRASSAIASDKLEDEVKRILEVKDLDKHVPANTGGATEGDLRRIIDWYRGHVRFLPGDKPDAWVGGLVEPSASIEGDGKNWWDSRFQASSGMLDSEYVTSDQRFVLHQAEPGDATGGNDA